MQDQRSTKITLDKDLQKKREEENYHKDVERERMEKEIERQRVEKLERLQRENEEMKKQLFQLSPPSSNLQVNVKKKSKYIIFAFSFFLSFISYVYIMKEE